MSEPFLGELRIISWNFPPKGWALCNGQLLPINQNQALFALLGTMYGGDGRQTFALPNLQGRVPMHVGNGHVQGESGGQTSHTVTLGELPAHTHAVNATSARATGTDPTGLQLARSTSQLYAPHRDQTGVLDGSSVTTVGGAQPHENMQPYLVLNVIIALQGIFPSQN